MHFLLPLAHLSSEVRHLTHKFKRNQIIIMLPYQPFMFQSRTKAGYDIKSVFVQN